MIYLWYYFDIQLCQIFWYWILGMVLGSAVSVFLKDYIHKTFRSLGEKKLGVFGIVIANALGIASPLCIFSGFLAGLSETRELPVDFSGKLFHRIVDYATVHSDGRVVFAFRNGAEVSIRI